MTKKKILIIFIIVVVVIIALGVGAYYFYLNMAFYKPGQLAEGIIEAPDQTGVAAGFWKMEAGIELAYFTQGQGETPVLFIHGGPGFPPLEAWSAFDELGEQYTFYYYHQRGCGDSTRPVDTFSDQNTWTNMKELDQKLGLGEQITDIEKIRQILKQDKLNIIGHSFGGYLASLYAVEFPEHVDKMILVAPAGVLRMPNKSADNLFTIMEDTLKGSDQEAFKEWQERYFNFDDIFTKSDQELAELNYEYVNFYEKVLLEEGLTLPDSAKLPVEKTGGWMVQGMYISPGMKYDFRSSLKEVQVPVLVMVGENDFAGSASVEYADLFPKGELKTITGASHFPHEETPEEFRQIVADYLSSNDE